MSKNEKKYLVPIEMDKDYAAKIGVPANEIKTIMLEGKPTEVYFVEVESEEMYHELMRPIWQADKAYKRRNRCMVSNGKGSLIRCEGNCADCEHRGENAPLSIEAIEESGGITSLHDNGVHVQMDSAMYESGADEIVEDAMIIEYLWECIGKLSEVDQLIVKMFSEGASEQEIAPIVGLTPPAIHYRKKKIFEKLKKYF